MSIPVGDSVNFTNDGGFHNACVSKPGSDPTSCDEFKNGDPSFSWAAYTNSHQFNSAGTYSLICSFHGTAMSATITVGGGGGTTTTSTGTGTTPTGTGTGTGTGTTPTQTTPTQTTQTETSPADTTAPAFTGRLKRRASRKSLRIDLGSSEDATLTATVFRRAPHAHRFARVGSASIGVHRGRNVVTLPRKAAGKVRSGAYRVRLQLADAAGNRSATRTLVFKVA